jgi:hypothetical protein
MATSTTKLLLRKPATTDLVNVTTDISDNMDLIDSKLPHTRHVRKTSTESVVSSTTLQDDNQLLFAIAANEVWEFEVVIFLDDTGSPEGCGAKLSIAVPSGCSIKVGAVGEPAESIQDTIGATFYDQVILTAGAWLVVARGIAVNGATPGNVQLQWAQAVSDSDALEVEVNSYLVAHRIT